MVNALFDTNILIDYLNGVVEAAKALESHEVRTISIITRMEVLVGMRPETEVVTKAFLSSFDQLPLDDRIAERAVDIRRTKRIKLPDAIIAATADIHGLLLVTRDTRDFGPDGPEVRMPYQAAR